jgi:hypothetical protein
MSLASGLLGGLAQGAGEILKTSIAADIEERKQKAIMAVREKYRQEDRAHNDARADARDAVATARYEEGIEYRNKQDTKAEQERNMDWLDDERRRQEAKKGFARTVTEFDPATGEKYEYDLDASGNRMDEGRLVGVVGTKLTDKEKMEYKSLESKRNKLIGAGAPEEEIAAVEAEMKVIMGGSADNNGGGGLTIKEKQLKQLDEWRESGDPRYEGARAQYEKEWAPKQSGQPKPEPANQLKRDQSGADNNAKPSDNIRSLLESDIAASEKSLDRLGQGDIDARTLSPEKLAARDAVGQFTSNLKSQLRRYEKFGAKGLSGLNLSNVSMGVLKAALPQLDGKAAELVAAEISEREGGGNDGLLSKGHV